MAATKTRYTVPAVADQDEKTYSTKKSATDLADRRAAEYGETVEVTTQTGKVVYTATAPVAADELPAEPETETETEILDEVPADLGEESQVAPDEDDDHPRAECGCLVSDLVFNGEHSEDCTLLQPADEDEETDEAETETEEPTTEEILAALPESSDVDPTPEELAEAEAEIVAGLAEKGIETAEVPAEPETVEPEAADETETETETDEPLVGGALDFSEVTFTTLLRMAEDFTDPQNAAAKAEWKRRMDTYDASMRTKKGERLVGPAMCIALETGASRDNGNMLDVDGRARYALIQRGLIDATYEEQGSKRVLVKAVINAKGLAALWR